MAFPFLLPHDPTVGVIVITRSGRVPHPLRVEYNVAMGPGHTAVILNETTRLVRVEGHLYPALLGPPTIIMNTISVGIPTLYTAGRNPALHPPPHVLRGGDDSIVWIFGDNGFRSLTGMDFPDGDIHINFDRRFYNHSHDILDRGEWFGDVTADEIIAQVDAFRNIAAVGAVPL
jgi:hypothetical protein